MVSAAGINVLLGMVRVKFAVVLIGTTGVGLLANFGVLQDLIDTPAVRNSSPARYTTLQH